MHRSTPVCGRRYQRREWATYAYGMARETIPEMRRRAYLRTVGAGVATMGSGCLGTGGEVVVGVTESVSIGPGDGWVREIPDVSDTGGAVSYTIRSSQRAFDVYFFVGEEQYGHYDSFVGGTDPEETPRGHSSFSKAAVPRSEAQDVYEAATNDGGAREPLDVTGPYYFVVDHSNYRMENRVDEHGDPLTAFVDLEVVRQRSVL